MSGVSQGNDGRQSSGGYVSSEGVNGTFGIVRLGSARVENVLSMSATLSAVSINRSG